MSQRSLHYSAHEATLPDPLTERPFEFRLDMPLTLFCPASFGLKAFGSSSFGPATGLAWAGLAAELLSRATRGSPAPH
jgi:hypothetical protein